MKKIRYLIIGVLAMTLLNGCATQTGQVTWSKPIEARSPIQDTLVAMPKLDGPKITIAVYSFSDKTGQRKPSDSSNVILADFIYGFGLNRKINPSSFVIIAVPSIFPIPGGPRVAIGMVFARYFIFSSVHFNQKVIKLISSFLYEDIIAE